MTLKSSEMKRIFIFILSTLIALPFFAQSEGELKKYFEGKMIVPLIDLPGSTDGIYIFPEKDTPLDYGDYGNDLKKFGPGAYANEAILITKVVVKKNHIRLELGGGGYGGFFAESAYVSTPQVAKSKAELELEKKISDAHEDDEKELRKELNRLRAERREEQARLDMEAEHAKAIKEERIAKKRATSGSRIHIKYDRRIRDSDLMINIVLDNLAKYALLEEDMGAPDPMPASNMANIKKGMSWGEANMILGMPLQANTIKDNGLTVITCRYMRNGELITAKYVEGLLVSYSISSE